ncbi:MAG: histidine--tRNA ligase [Flavobacteriaceae bacterium]
MSIKPSIPKGTRDYHPNLVSKRNYIIQKLKDNFIRFGYHEIQTPSFEKSNILKGNYGQEGDRLIFNILNSGEKVKKANINSLKDDNLSEFVNSISDKALRYDLTVPLARYVSQYQNEIKFPFKRFQIQNVWRADRPQKGRFQEFTQCDADVIGSDSILNEIEMINIYAKSLNDLGLKNLELKINHRAILNSISKKIELNSQFKKFMIILDKIEKIGQENVIKELIESLSLKDKYIEDLKFIFNSKSNSDILEFIEKQYIIDEDSKIALGQLKTIKDFFDLNSYDHINISFDLSLARGLDYYTGVIFEISSNNHKEIGSIGGGGRYNDLTKRFSTQNLSGIGISFGLERIFYILENDYLFPDSIDQQNEILVLNFGIEYIKKLDHVINYFRKSNNLTIYPDESKIIKQFSYADHNKFRSVLIFGKDEDENNIFKIKNMESGIEKIINITNFKED